MSYALLDEAGISELFHDPTGPVAVIMASRAYAVVNAARLELVAPGGGREYLPGHYLLFKGGKWYAWTRYRPAHRASAPGRPPASDTGILLASVTWEATDTEDGVGARIGSPDEYALYLELGTRLMEARPFLRPALDAADVEVVDELPDVATLPPGRLYFTPLAG